MLIGMTLGGTYSDFWAQAGLRRFHTKVASTPARLDQGVFDGLQELSAAVYGLGDLSRLLAQARTVCLAGPQALPSVALGAGPRLGLVRHAGLKPTQVAAAASHALSFDTLVGSRIAVLEDEVVAALSRPGSEPWAACAAFVAQATAQLSAQGAERIVLSLGQRAAEEGFLQLALRAAPPHLLGSVPVASTTALVADTDPARATWTALLNAFLHPSLEGTLCRIEDKLQRLGCPAPLLVMGSDGLAAWVRHTAALRTWDAGAQAGLRGAAALARAYGIAQMAALEIGASRTHFGIVSEGQVPLAGPLDTEGGAWLPGRASLRSLAIGGHSALQAEAGSVRVSSPPVGDPGGPACFGHGSRRATLADLKLIQGQIEPRRYFAGRLALHVVRSEEAVMACVAAPLGLAMEAAVQAAEAAWVDSVAGALKSWVPPQAVLCAYGGAGPLVACAVAERLGVGRVLVPGAAAVFGASVLGQGAWGERHDLAVPAGWDQATAQRELAGLVARAEAGAAGGTAPGAALQDGAGPGWQRRWWWAEGGHAREIDSRSLPGVLVRRRGSEPGVVSLTLSRALDDAEPPRDRRLPALSPRPGATRRMWLGGLVQEVPLLLLAGQPHGARGEGPVVIEDDYFTLPVPAGWQFRVTLLGDIDLQRA